uniref:Dynein light chain 1, cytoplasmic n=1 Tax=Ciona savignyi TaxID=51511 RepID=H2YQN5_CIOSA
MTEGRGHSYVSFCAFLAFLSSVLTFEAFRQNTWGKWRKLSAVSNCLPLPPPIGCAEWYGSKDVLDVEDTDFAWLVLIASIISLCSMVISVLMLGNPELTVTTGEHTLNPGCLAYSFASSATISFLTCVIATFRIGVVATLRRKQGLFSVGGITAVNSTSYYFSVLATLFSILAAYVISKIPTGKPPTCDKLSKTVKQHIARNLMYPDDQRSTKMVTFSSMEPPMEEVAAEICVKAVVKYGLEEDVAENIKMAFEEKFGPTWHCAVGSNFGSAIHHKTTEYIEVSMPQLSVLLFRCNEPNHGDHHATSADMT